MNVPDNAQLFDFYLTTVWVDDDGIVCYKAKDALSSVEGIREIKIGRVSAKKKACALIDTTHAWPIDRETRQYLENELHRVYKAVAITSESLWGRMIAKTFIVLNKPSIPVKVFASETEARKWLKGFSEN